MTTTAGPTFSLPTATPSKASPRPRNPPATSITIIATALSPTSLKKPALHSPDGGRGSAPAIMTTTASLISSSLSGDTTFYCTITATALSPTSPQNPDSLTKTL